MIAAGSRFILLLDGASLPSKQLIGGKAWSIARMQALGLPVPPAFVITTEACRHYLDSGRSHVGLLDQAMEGIRYLEKIANRRFGGEQRPLLVSVRSGAPVSMPGMMDTVLNLGMNDQTEHALAVETGDGAFARDSHRRLMELYARIVLRASVEELAPNGSPLAWREMIAAAGNGGVPDSPAEQLDAAIHAVFDSWNSRRAKKYRTHHGIADDMGTAVTVQAMVFGNGDERSGSGVLFSRNPLTGENKVYGEYLAKAQGEDVVSGSHTPEPLDKLSELMPALYAQLLSAASMLENENGDVQDIEFTVERGSLYLLQSRAAKRAPQAAVRIAIDKVAVGQWSVEQALARVSAEQVRTMLRPRLANDIDLCHAQAIAHGEAASPGVGVGVVATSADEAEALASRGQRVVLMRPTTSPEDLHGMLIAEGVVTERGGSTSHAAVVSRQLGVACVVGCGDGALANLHGKTVTVDGSCGKVYAGALAVEQPNEDGDPDLKQIRTWATARSPLRVFRVGHEIPPGATDLDVMSGGDEVANTRELLRGARGAVGAVLNTDDGVRAALEAGVEFIVVRHELPALLAACAAGVPPLQGEGSVNVPPLEGEGVFHSHRCA